MKGGMIWWRIEVVAAASSRVTYIVVFLVYVHVFAIHYMSLPSYLFLLEFSCRLGHIIPNSFLVHEDKIQL